MKYTLTNEWGNITYTTADTTHTTVSGVICPDLLRLSDLGVADNWRGRIVRGFFRALRVVTGI